jgi:hypothetical protein
MLKEIEEANNVVREQRKVLQQFANQIAALEKEQFQPRMMFLQSIEIVMKQKLSEFILSEEKLETSFLCPKDLKLLNDPITFYPCGHTFCACCVDDMTRENFNVLKCSVCKSHVEKQFKNEKLANVKEQMEERRKNTQLFFDFLKTLNSDKKSPSNYLL